MNRENYELIENYMLSCMGDSAHGKEELEKQLFE